jgi:putative ABC transport system substrate-binding protein
MRRRDFVKLISVGIVSAGKASAQGSKVGRIGVLMGYSEADPEARARLTSFQRRLHDLGWREGLNTEFFIRWTAGDRRRVLEIAKELVGLRPDAIFAATTPGVEALRRETASIPIVFVAVSDPIGSGFVESLARPGGNVTGFINLEASLGSKWLELLHEVVPSLRRVAMMFNPDTAPYAPYYLDPFQAAAASLSIEAIAARVRSVSDIEGTIAMLARERSAGGLIVMTDSYTTVQREQIISLAAAYGVPAIYPLRYMAAEGGLLSYGVDTAHQYPEAGAYVHRILNGAQPSDLPVQLPTKFEMGVNLKTARSLRLTIPLSLLARADEVIE